MRKTGFLFVVAATVTTTSCANVAEPTPTLLARALTTLSGGTECGGSGEQECVLIGRMTGGGGQLTIGNVYVTRGFTLHCDILLSNNLEINWPGNKWHLDKPITKAVCTDDPDIAPEPPPAPFDTFYGEATGRLNGVDGSFARWVFADAGEPGGRNDRSAIQIFSPSGELVLDVPYSFLTRGNLQAHFDQPHR